MFSFNLLRNYFKLWIGFLHKIVIVTMVGAMVLLLIILTLLNLQNWKLQVDFHGFLGFNFLPIFTHLLEVWATSDQNLQRCFHILCLCSDKNCLPVRILLIYGNQTVICMTTFSHVWRENGCSQAKVYLFICHFCHVQYSTVIDNFCLVMTFSRLFLPLASLPHNFEWYKVFWTQTISDFSKKSLLLLLQWKI